MNQLNHSTRKPSPLTTYLAMFLMLLTSLSPQALAGAFVFAEQNGINIITHPIGYTGTGGEITITVGIDSTSTFATDMQISVQNIVKIFNGLMPTTGNLILGAANNVPSNAIDFESVALHELGHALGLAHPNLASESGQTGANANYTKSTRGPNNAYNLDSGSDGVRGSADDDRGDDVNLHWFNTANNNPFTIAGTVDETTYSRTLADLPGDDTFATNADRAVSTLLGVPGTEAAMQQGSFNDEAQRTLGHDDVATLRLAMAGLDRTAGTADDYTIRLEYVGLVSNADILIDFDNSQTGFAVTQTGGVFLATDHIGINSASMFFNTGFTWFFNDQAINEAPVITGQQPLTTPAQTALTITLNDLIVTDSDNTYPDDFTLTVLDGASYSRVGNTITPNAGVTGNITVPVRVNDGNDDSNVFDLTVNVTGGTPPAITAQPQDLTRCIGAASTFIVVATGSGLSYQWRKGGVAVPDATQAAFTIFPIAAGDAGSYDVVVTNGAGSVTSDTVDLNVVGNLAVSIMPEIAVKGLGPVNLTGQFTCTTDGLAWEWRNDTTSTQIATNQVNVAIGSANQATTMISLNLLSPKRGSNSATMTILGSNNPVYFDLNGDGCNSIEDRYQLAESWRNSIPDDPNGDGIIDVRDFLHINVSQTAPCGP